MMRALIYIGFPPFSDDIVTCLVCFLSNSINAFFLFVSRNLQGNPLSCNCHLAWFSEWLKKRDSGTTVSGHCHEPPRLKDAAISDIPRHEFKCNSEYTYIRMRGRDPLCPVSLIPPSPPLASDVLYINARPGRSLVSREIPAGGIPGIYVYSFNVFTYRNKYTIKSNKIS